MRAERPVLVSWIEALLPPGKLAVNLLTSVTKASVILPICVPGCGVFPFFAEPETVNPASCSRAAATAASVNVPLGLRSVTDGFED